MSNIVFAAILPHPPIILPSVGSEEDRNQVKKTIENLKNLGEEFKKAKPNSIIISAPHPDWGIKVPLHFLILNSTKLGQFKIQNYQNANNIIIDLSSPQTIYPILTTFDSPKQHYQWGQNLYQLKIRDSKLKIALIASGDLSHCLKKDGPYGLHPDGAKFDKDLIENLKKKDIEKILKLDELYPKASECGLRSFCFTLGILEESKINYQPKILSYECSFGVGYLVASFQIKNEK